MLRLEELDTEAADLSVSIGDEFALYRENWTGVERQCKLSRYAL